MSRTRTRSGSTDFLAPRLEMMPLLDVVFLLLTFFIYSFVVMVRADTLAVELSPVAGGGGSAAGAAVEVLTIDGAGELIYDGRPIGGAALDTLLRDLAADPASPTLFVSQAAEGTADRGPVLFELIQRIERAGLRNVSLVGPPVEDGGGGDAGGG
ncbi:MAG: biopolymer transporter ExbD [Planctomycetota bacterium]